MGGGGGGVVEDSNDIGLHVITEKMKISSNLQVGKILIHRMFPTDQDNFKCLYSRISSI